MTPAEKRIKELIDRWLTSLDLHLQYVELNDSAYNRVQPWPVHDRPTRWVIELAKQKTLELQAAFESRLAMGDAKFAEAMEHMLFLANLVGSQNVQRYIPLADPERHGQATLTELDGLTPVRPVSGKSAAADKTNTGATTVEATIERTVAMPPRAPAIQVAPPPKPASQPTPKPAPAPPSSPTTNDDATREMPRPMRPAAAAPTVKPAQPTAQKTAPVASAATAPAKGAAPVPAQQLIIEDAVRLLMWGRPWHELAELIARIADRPKVAEVRRILRSHRAEIETRAAAEPEAKP